MALPTITSNSPSAGYIAWTAFGIQINGVGYSVAAGNTASKFVWWEYRAGVPALVSGNTIPDLAAEDILLFLNKTGVGALVPTMDMVDGSLLVNGSVLANAIAANQINSTHIISDAITADHIAVGAVTAEHVAAGSITTDKLSVGTVGDSLVANGSFEEFANGMPLGWRIFSSTNGGSADVVSGVASSGTNALRMIATGATSTVYVEQTTDKFIPVSSTASRRWYVSARMGAGTAITNGVWLRVKWYDAAKAFVSFNDIVSNVAMGTSFAVYEGQTTPPAAARYMSITTILYTPNVATNVYVDEITAREVVISAQIGDGQITTAKLVANAVTASTVAAGQINAKHLVISDYTNLIQDPLLTRPAGEIWIRRSGATTASSIVSTTGGEGNAWRLDGVSTEVSVRTEFIEVQYDQKYFFNALIQNTLTGTSPVGYIRFEFFKKDKVTKVGTDYSYDVPTGTTWGNQSATFTPPVGAFYCRAFFIHGNNCTGSSWWIANPQLRRMNGGELIVDGSIIATKIATNAVSADKIIANAVTADKINAGAVTADKIDANAINGKTITGATIQTSATNPRIVLDSTSLRGFNSTGLEYLKADANGLSIDGTVTKTGGTNWLGNEVVVKISAAATTEGTRNIGGISFEETGEVVTQHPAIYSDSGMDLVLTSRNDSSFLSLSNENAFGVAELQGSQGINLFSNNGDVKIGKTYNTAGNLIVDKINGKQMTDSGWQTATLVNGFTHRTSFGWPGAQWRIYNGFIIIQGSVTNTSAWGVGAQFVSVPTGYNLTYRVMGSNAYLDSANACIAAEAGGTAGGAINFYVTWPLP